MSVGKSLVILQSNYIPWKGYFDLVAAADEFVIFDEVQYTKNDWRNRNRIILNGEPRWLTIAVKTAGAFGESIESAEVSNPDWARGHWETIRQAYRRAPYFREVAPELERVYGQASSLARLSEINELFLRRISQMLGLGTEFIRSTIVPRTTQDPTERLLEICRARDARRYISGPAARSYLCAQSFLAAGFDLRYADYSGYPDYAQASTRFEHGVSILDVLFQCGAAGARAQLKSIREPGSFHAPGIDENPPRAE